MERYPLDLNSRSILPLRARMLRLREVTNRTGLSGTTIWRLERKGLFPRRRRISPGRVGWLEQDIEDYLNACPEGGPRGT